MKTLRWIIPAFAIALLPLWACQTEDGEQASDTTIIEDTEPDLEIEEPDLEIEEPDVIVEDEDGVSGEIRVDDEGVEGEVRTD